MRLLLTVVMGYDVIDPIRSSGRYRDFNYNPAYVYWARDQLRPVRATCIYYRWNVR